MAVPEISDLLIPLLLTVKDKDEYKVTEITDEVIDVIDLDESDKEIKLPNNERLIDSRISSANTYLRKAELVESNRFMYYKITDEGVKMLEENPDGLTEEDLMQYDGFKEFKKIYTHDDDVEVPSYQDALKESLEKTMQEVRDEISNEAMKENKVKYFQSKKDKENKELYEIKSRKDDLNDKKAHRHRHHMSKCHDKKHKIKKYILIKDSPADELLKYAELFERGYLTKEEFEKKKEELLNL